MSIREASDLTRAEREQHARKWGSFNDFPPGWREITMADYAKSADFTFTPTLVEFRQMLTSDRRAAAVSARLHFHHNNTGFASVSDFWAGKVRYYAFGCARPHANRSTCPECGFRADYDTSD